jgi:hypothetical protein
MNFTNPYWINSKPTSLSTDCLEEVNNKRETPTLSRVNAFKLILMFFLFFLGNPF